MKRKRKKKVPLFYYLKCFILFENEKWKMKSEKRNLLADRDRAELKERFFFSFPCLFLGKKGTTSQIKS